MGTVPTVTLSPSYTLLGKLQRGLGAGFLEALRVERDAAHELVLACLDEDPRREPGEARGRYYGELCVETRIDLRALASRVEAADTSPGTRRLVLETVGWLAWRGVEGPMAMLRDYALAGGADAVFAASFLWHPRAREGVDAALLARYAEREQLSAALAAGGASSDREPWRGWCATHPALANAFALAAPAAEPEPEDEQRVEGEPLALLEALGLALERDECVCALARGLAASSGDPFALLERAFRSTTRSSCRVTIAQELARTGGRLPARSREWLWDAEPAVVVAALGRVEADDAAAAARVDALRRDGWPVPDVAS
jgi:hypothetical protein